ncbi:MAG: S-layer homology domain-containing protein [Eggerthellaceae bacterium]|nr:S-layer homology domain-containing protein [Eggerthellaceae bacterium]
MDTSDSEDTEDTTGCDDLTVGHAYYTKACNWAASCGCMTGYDDGTDSFGLDEPVTQKQAVAILYRYAQNNGVAVSMAGSLIGCPDEAKGSDFACPAMI